MTHGGPGDGVGSRGWVRALRTPATATVVAVACLLLAPGLAWANPSVTASPKSGSPGLSMGVSGAGWIPGHTIFIEVGSNVVGTDVACSVIASPSGSFSEPLNGSSNPCKVPDVPAGNRLLFAVDYDHTSSTATGPTFKIIPLLVLTPIGAVAGDPASPYAGIHIDGHGFAANSSVSKFKFNGTALLTNPHHASTATDANGNFLTTTIEFGVPVTAPRGNNTVSGTDLSGNTGSATLKTYRPTVSASPMSGPPGTPLHVTGSGWLPSQPLLIQIGEANFNTDVACLLYASSSGALDSTAGDNCKVPNAPAYSGYYVYGVEYYHQGVIALHGLFNLVPGLALTPANAQPGDWGSPGAMISAQGNGFSANKTVSTFKFGARPLSVTPASVTTNAQGSFNSPVTFKIPASAPAGNDTVYATDSAAKAGGGTIRIYRPTIVASPTSGPPGTALHLTGVGWPASLPVLVQIGSKTFGSDTVCVLYATASGVLNSTASDNCKVPNVPTGTQPLIGFDYYHQGVLANGAHFTVT